ncbi:MAG TPA: 30S ribosomal protein S20 [Actinomycetota bacterium]|nr:30S ribosomal protein S20 [Actinomycetota bacterium]
MANIKSQIKRIRQNERRRVRNKAVRTRLKSAAKDVVTAAESGDPESATTRLREAGRLLDKAAARRAVHPRTAARRKSRLARRVAASQQATPPEQP